MSLWAVSSKLGQDGFREWFGDIGSADFRLSNGTALIILPTVLAPIVSSVAEVTACPSAKRSSQEDAPMHKAPATSSAPAPGGGEIPPQCTG